MSTTYRLPVVLLVLCLLGTTTLHAADAPPFGDRSVVRVHIANEAELQQLSELEAPGIEIELWSEVLMPGVVEFQATSAGLARLAAAGFAYEVIIPDVNAYFAAQYAAGDGNDFFNAIRTYDEHRVFLHDLAAAYPNLATVFDPGHSVEDRPLWGLHITGRGLVKPAILYHGAQHGNEKAAASIAAYVAYNLLTGYGVDPVATALVDHADWYIVPIMNPDGYVRNTRRNAHNVDLNRNWDGPGSGQDPSGGPYPFSEPETQAMRDLLLAHPTLRVHVDLHGYTNKIMGPWGHKAEPPPHHARFMAAGQEMAARVAAAGGGTYSVGPVYTTLYPISGGSTDYTYGVLGRWCWLIEVKNSTVPAICEHFLDALFYLGDWIWSLDCNGNGVDDPDDILGGWSLDLNGNQKPDECEPIGDLNCDDLKDFADINPYVLALTDPVGYAQAFPDCDRMNADINGDGKVDFGDINPFVALLTHHP